MGERFPEEFHKTNELGSWNVSRIAKDSKVPKCILISTDKAVKPQNVYGKTKAYAELVFRQVGYSVIRFGNFWGSRGSVIPLWKEQATKGYIEMTDPSMQRYFITFEDAVRFTMGCIENYKPQHIWTPMMRLWTLKELAQEVCPNVPIRLIGNRGNEKLREEL